MTWIEQDVRVLSRIHISRELRVFGVKFQTQIFVCVKNLTFRNSAVECTIVYQVSFAKVCQKYKARFAN